MKKTTDLFNHGLESGMRRLAAPTAALAFALGGCAGVYAQEKVWFDPMLMEQGDPGQRGVDLSIFSTKDRLPAGNYPLRIRLNGSEMFTRTITLTVDAQGETHPVITPALLEELNVKTDAYPALAALAPLASIEDIGALIPAASVRLNTHKMALDVSIPQAALRRAAPLGAMLTRSTGMTGLRRCSATTRLTVRIRKAMRTQGIPRSILTCKTG